MAHDKGYVDAEYLHLAAEQLAQLKRYSYMLMCIKEGDHALDVGCGPGTDTVPMAALVGAEGKIDGVDADAAMVAAADTRAAEEGLSSRATHHVGSALSLPFADRLFDACRSERLFQHLSNPGKALSEMVRVTKPGGRIVVIDTDWGSMSVDSTETEVERQLSRVHAEQVFNNGYAGRQLYGLFRQQNLDDVSVELFANHITNYPVARTLALMDETEHLALASGVITQDDLQRWHKDLEQAANEGLFFASVTVVLAAGQVIG